MFRYLNRVGCRNAAIAPDGHDLWIWCVYVATVSEGFQHNFDLSSPMLNPFLPSYLCRVSAETGDLVSVTRFPALWLSEPGGSGSGRMVVDSTGAIWMGGYAGISSFPVTADAAERIPYPYVPSGIPQVPAAGPITLMKLSPEGDRITYATNLRGRAMGALTLDENDNLYVVGEHIWKLSPKGEMLWSASLGESSHLGLTIAYHPQGGLAIGGCIARSDAYTSAGAFQTASQDPPGQVNRPSQFYPYICKDGFVARFTAQSEFVYSTLLGGPGRDQVLAVSIDNQGSVTADVWMQEPPSNTKEINWVPNAVTRTPDEYLAHLSPDGSSASYFTPFNIGGVPTGTPGILLEDGSLLAIRYQGRSLGNSGSTAALLVYHIKRSETAPVTVDRVIVSGDRDSGYRLEIHGRGFGDGATATLDGMSLQIADRTTSDVLKTAAFKTRPPLDSAFVFPYGEIANYNLMVRSKDGITSQIVQVSLQYPRAE